MISVENLSVNYGEKSVLSSVTLQIPAGSWTCIVGPNGAGKTTLLKTLLGMHPYSGSIKVGGVEVFKDMSRNVAFVPQRPEIPLGMTVIEYLALGRSKIDGWGREKRAGRLLIQKTLDETQLVGLQNQLVTHLSGGELQRV